MIVSVDPYHAAFAGGDVLVAGSAAFKGGSVANRASDAPTIAAPRVAAEGA